MAWDDWQKLQDQLGLQFCNLELLKRAFAHGTSVNQFAQNSENDNRLLAFVGDSLLSLCVRAHLYTRYAGVKTKQQIVRCHGSLTSSAFLATVVEELDIVKFLLREPRQQLGVHDSGDLLEALIFAIYLDKGFPEAAAFVEKHILAHAPQFLDLVPFDPKRELLRRLNERDASDHSSLNYRVVSDGTDGRDVEIAVVLCEVVIGCGSARLAKDARNAAAQDAINRL